MSETICAVIVTNNRLKWLQPCIAACRSQTRALNEMIIINCGSTDGTREWLDGQSDLTTVHQANIGAAGGVRLGIQLAYDKGHDWIWVLDDDCLPDSDALLKLVEAIAARPSGKVFNSLCLAKENPARPTHGAICVRTNASDYLWGEYIYSAEAIRARADAHGMVDTIGGQLYLGTLFHRTVVENIGLPVTEFFLRGDEIDYGIRMMEAGYHIWSVTTSIVYHPGARIIYWKVLGKQLPCEMMSPTKRYYGIRNSIYIRKK